MNNYINYKDYNDYELIYLIKEGNESALNFFFDKYEKYIKKIVYSIYQNEEFDMEDCIQEGRISLYECIYKYNDDSETSFFSFFTVVFKRKLIRLLQNNIKTSYILCEDSVIDYLPRKREIKLEGKSFFSDKLKIDIFNSCIIGNISLRNYAKQNNMTYHKVYYIYNKMIEELKDLF